MVQVVDAVVVAAGEISIAFEHMRAHDRLPAERAGVCNRLLEVGGIA